MGNSVRLVKYPAYLVMTLVLAAASASAGASAKAVTAQQVLAMVKADGAYDTVASLFRTGSWEASVMPGIKTAQPRWLEVARVLQPATDAGSAEDLDDALSEALVVAPYRVLPLLKETWWKTDLVCTFGWDSDFEEGVEHYVLRLRAALDRTPPPPKLAQLRAECVRGIDQTLKDVREHPGSEPE